MKANIEALENQVKTLKEENELLKNGLQNKQLNNDHLVDEMEKMKIENEELREEIRIGRREKSEGENREERKRKTEKRELEEMKNELGEKGGIGHFWEDDRAIENGGVRDHMKKEELKKVARAISLGQKEVNLKEREFLAFF